MLVLAKSTPHRLSKRHIRLQSPSPRKRKQIYYGQGLQLILTLNFPQLFFITHWRKLAIIGKADGV